jgi:hypothetical protein
LRALEGAQATDAIADCSLRDVGAARQCLECAPYALEPVQWLLVIWLLVRWVRLRDDRLLLAFGVLTGIAVLTKFQVLLLCVVLVVAVAARGPRDLLRRRPLWVGAGIAVVLAAPTLVWQQLHGWPQLRMAPVVAGEAEALYGGRPGIAVQLIVLAGVAGAALAVYGLSQLFGDDELRDYGFIGVAFVMPYVVFVATAGRPYYLAGLSYAGRVVPGGPFYAPARVAAPANCVVALAFMVGSGPLERARPALWPVFSSAAFFSSPTTSSMPRATDGTSSMLSGHATMPTPRVPP